MVPEQGNSNGNSGMNAGESVASDQHHAAQDTGAERYRSERPLGYEVPSDGSPQQSAPTTVVEGSAPAPGKAVPARKTGTGKRRTIAGYLSGNEANDGAADASPARTAGKPGRARLRTAVVAAGAVSLAAAAVALAGWKRK